MRGESILNPHYDHATGQMTKPKAIHPNDVIISSGLHALSDPELRRKYNLSVFLDMDESLRLFLKLRRDVSERGHEYSKVVSSMEFREGDRQRFILPQRSEADLVIRLAPATKIEITEAALADPIPRFVVSIIFRQSLPVDDLIARVDRASWSKRECGECLNRVQQPSWMPRVGFLRMI